MKSAQNLKRMTALLLAALVLFTACAALAETVTVKGYKVRLREKPSTKSEVIDAYPSGTKATLLEKRGEWAKVRIRNKTGWMMTAFLRDKNGNSLSSGSGSGSSGGTVMYVRTYSGDKLNLRAEPNSYSEVLGRYKDGTRVTVLKRGTYWVKVSVDGKVGYMGSEYLVSSK